MMWRRLAAVALGPGVLLVLAAVPAAASIDAAAREPAPRTPIEHVVTLMQESHSFDNYFGTYPGANGIPAGVCVPREPPARTPCVLPYSLGNRPLENLDNDRVAFEVARNGGAMNGFLAAQRNRVANDLTMGHYRRIHLEYAWNLADRYVLFDRFFSSSNGGSVPNHLYWVAGTGGPPGTDSVPAAGFGELPTIFDRLQTAGVSWKFYVQNYDPRATFRRGPHSERSAQIARVPLLAYARYVDDPELFSHIVPVEQYFEDLQSGTLPAVSYIVPSGASERPPSSVQSGQRFVRSLVDGLIASKQWSRSAFILTYANWGGWYDHVPPPQVDRDGYGFRVPALLVSPYAKRGHIDHTQLDFTSILRFIEDNWSLPPLATRDAAAASLTSAFDFAAAPRPATFVPADRSVTEVATANTSLVVALYGLVSVGAIVLIVAVTRRPRPRSHAVAR
jgi:phospholipase C